MFYQLAWRNIWRNPRRTLIILTAIVIGIASMIVLAAFMRGMMDGMVDNAIHNLVGDVQLQNPSFRIDPAIEHRITAPEALLASITPLLPPATQYARRIKIDGMLSTSREHRGIMLVGIIPEDERGLSFIGKGLTEGQMFSADESNSMVIGQRLLDKLNSKIGRKVVVTGQDIKGENVAKAFRIRGVYRTELAVTEESVVFVPLKALQDMLGCKNDVTEISLGFTGPQDHDPEQLLQRINKRLVGKNVQARDWRQLLPAMDAYLKMFNGFMLVWYMVVFIAMGFGLVNTMLMAVYERMREFGLLKAIGMGSRKIVFMVLGETLLLLLVGATIANLLALVLVQLTMHTGIDLSRFTQGTEMWGISRIIFPVLTSWDILTANAVVLLLGLLVGLYPAIRAARFTPVETMRHL